MAINLNKITSDLENADPQIKTFALISVTRLSPNLVDDTSSVRGLYGRLEELIRSDNPDVVFLARKATNHLRAQFRSMIGDEERSAPAIETDPARMDRGQLKAALKDASVPETTLATVIVRLVDKGGREDLDDLIRFLHHENDRVRSNALEVFARWGGPEHVELVRPLASDPSNRVRGTALLALDRFGFDGVDGLLREMLQLPAISMRETAVWVLSQIEEPWCAAALVQALEDPYDGIRLRAVRALAKYPTRESVRALKQALNDIDINICEAAAESLRALKVLIQGRAEAQKSAQQEAAAPIPPAPAEPAEASPAPAATDASLVAERAPVVAPTPPAPVADAGWDEVRRELGTAVYQLCRLNAVTHQELDRTFYEILRYQDFLRAYLIKRQKQERQGGESDSGEAIRQLQGRISKAFVELGDIAERLLEAGEIRVPAEQQAEIGSIRSRLRRE